MYKVNDAFLSLIPDGYFRKYLDLMIEMNNETPLPFHFLSIIPALGNMLGFECWGKMNKGVLVYPNINSLLISPSGLCRRGEGSKFAMKIAKRAGLNVFECTKLTPEGLYDEINDEDNPAGKGNVLLYIEELSTALGKREHVRPLIPILTKVLLNTGGPIEERTRGRGRLTAERSNVNAVMTSALTWFVETMPEEVMSGGLMSRLMICYLPNKEVSYVDLNAEGDEDARLSHLATELAYLGKSSPRGHIRATNEANKEMQKWYRSNERLSEVDERLDPHKSREPSNVVRLAMLMAIANKEDVISKNRLEQAINIVDWFRPTVGNMYGNADMLSNSTRKGEDRVIRKLIRSNGECMHREFLQGIYGGFRGMKDIKNCLYGLKERGIVEVITHKGQSENVWPPKGWRLVDWEKYVK